jgi:hypothetical protein
MSAGKPVRTPSMSEHSSSTGSSRGSPPTTIGCTALRLGALPSVTLRFDMLTKLDVRKHETTLAKLGPREQDINKSQATYENSKRVRSTAHCLSPLAALMSVHHPVVSLLSKSRARSPHTREIRAKI